MGLQFVNSTLYLVILAFAALCPCFVPVIKAGLAVDQVIDWVDSQFGDNCSYNAFVAFRLPILEIKVRTYGEYEKQNIQMESYESFTYTDPENKTTTLYDYIPREFQDVICRSSTVPLMCNLTDPATGDGKCVCLRINVTDTESGRDVVQLVRTSPFKYTERANRSDLFYTDEEDETDVEEKSNSMGKNGAEAPDGARSSSTTSRTTASASTEEDEEVTLHLTTCLAEPHTFCGTPYFTCSPYEGKRGMVKTACVLARCSATCLLPLLAPNVVLVITMVMHLVRY
jgi:hypothetical protein